MRIPYEMLDPSTLRNLLEEFVTRAGTDYGEREFGVDEKIEDVLRQLRSGEVAITFDSATETCHIARVQ